MARRDEEYDWLNDPFDEKKAAAEAERTKTSTGMKVGLGCGCLLVVVVFCAMMLFAGVQFLSIMGS